MDERSAVGAGNDTALIERDREVHAIAASLEEARRGIGSVTVIEGEAGMGKSTIVEHAARLAMVSGMATLNARGTELEQIHAFGTASSLFAGLVRADTGGDLMQGAAMPARALFEPPLPDDGSPAADRTALVHALYWLTVNAAEHGPLLMMIDDAHWADEASLRFIAYLTERIEELPVALLVALRAAEASSSPVGEQVRSHPNARRHRLAPLSQAGVDALAGTLAASERDHPRRASLWSETGGNPFYVVELLRSDPVTLGSGAMSQHPGAADIPDAIQASIRRRLADEGGTARRVAEAIAVLDDEATLERVARLAEVSSIEATESVRHMIEREILDARRLAFIHPIVQTAVFEAIPRAVRPHVHRAAARVLEQFGASPSAIAGHLLTSEPASDEQSIAILREAAHAAIASGDAPGAGRFLSRALQESPGSHAEGVLLLEQAQAQAASGTADAADRFEQAIRRLDRSDERARARLAQGHALIQASRWPEAAKAFEAGLAELGPQDVELKSRLEAGYISSAYVGLHDHAEASRRLAHILEGPLTDPSQRELAAWSAFQQTLELRGTAAEAAALARRAVTGVQLEELVHTSQAIELVAGVLLSTGDAAEEIEMLGEALAAAHRLHAYPKVGVYAYCRSLPLYLTGQLQDAIADAETALAVHDNGWETFYPGTCASLAWAQLERGDLDAAQRAVAIDDERWGQRMDFQFMLQIARGRVAFVRGDLAEALTQFEKVRDAGAALGVRSTHVLADWRTWAAVVLRGLDRRQDAVRVAEEAVALAEGWDEPTAIGRARWALGIAHGGIEGIAQLRAASEHLEGGPAHLERTRVVVDLGAALRRAGHLNEARHELRRGAEIAHRLGAIAILERARSELAAAGARPRRYVVTGVGSLTPSELRVSRMAAEGRTNREVAQSLFVTPKAVEYHLANAYRKLQISSRAELPGALQPSPEAASV